MSQKEILTFEKKLTKKKTLEEIVFEQGKMHELDK